MRISDPKVYIISKTQLTPGLWDYLKDNDIAWKPALGVTCAESLIEFAGRNCYESWPKEDGTFENKNISRVREGNDIYINNILKSGHGSVLEHCTVGFLLELSRVATHELVRHRAGTAFAQSSDRYIRCDDISMYAPDIIKDNEEAYKVFQDAVLSVEKSIKELEAIYDIDNIKEFDTKKILTSAFRRIAPTGKMCKMVFTANHRTLRHVIELRTSKHAEIEIRVVFDKIATLLKEEFPNIYQDMSRNEDGEWIFENSKI
jgi:thymidylate synthase (FAD)